MESIGLAVNILKIFSQRNEEIFIVVERTRCSEFHKEGREDIRV
jgi:c-di-AMP phosphodiesterase-like protein